MDDFDSLDYSELQELIDKKLMLWIGTAAVPLSIVENKHFIDFVHTINKVDSTKFKYNIPCRQTLSTSVLQKLYTNLDGEKKKLLSDKESAVIVDGWLNKSSNDKLLVFTLRSHEIHNIFLAAHDINIETEDTKSLAANITNVIKLSKDKFNTDVWAVSTDNDAKIKAGAREARNTHGKQLLQATCCSHSGNLFIKTTAKNKFSDQVTDVATAFSDSKMTALLRKFKGTRIEKFPDTRFCFYRNTCQSIYKNLDAMKSIISIPDVTVSTTIADLVFSDTFKRNLQDNLRSLRPVCELINKCQDASKNIADGTEYWLALELPNNEFAEELEKRKKKAILPSGYAANLMHNKYLGIRMNDDQKTIALEYLKKHLDTEEGTAELMTFINNRANYIYFTENCDDPVTFWTMLRDELPQLSRLLLRLFLLPASTAMIESFFSGWNHVCTKWRNRLTRERSAMLADMNHFYKHCPNGRWINTINKKKRKYINIDEDMLVNMSDDEESDEEVLGECNLQNFEQVDGDEEEIEST